MGLKEERRGRSPVQGRSKSNLERNRYNSRMHVMNQNLSMYVLRIVGDVRSTRYEGARSINMDIGRGKTL